MTEVTHLRAGKLNLRSSRQLNQHQIRPHQVALVHVSTWPSNPADGRASGLVIGSVLDGRMFECSFSFMKLSLASSQSICASIAAASCGKALSREKSRTSMTIL
jgi:hypothetical protein